ncbi:MAG: DUF420 domain-containing protein [Phycisphaerae bacterium]
MTVHDLPHLNASLNALSAILIVAGLVMIRRKQVVAHKACMLTATAVSTVFLVCYLVYHASVGHVRFTEPGFVKTLYHGVLLSHVVLAAATPVLVTVTLYRALRGQLDRHERLARWTLPIWLYVSVTGVLVYLMLYWWFPPAGVRV